ncbi:phosphate acyltransferase [Candidatus Vecturithrix granuli]|uniref:Phosphate acyltransferase n=1 Tax=Vecturithrix granuli TaxID=1499967 RepID=A0A081CA31_VECG1|nr:phosphate acyltransferase [Candidatus Vecturithrix granuli]
MKIAVDAMGGDFAPEAIVEGAVQAAEEYGFPLVLVGQEDRVWQELTKYNAQHLQIEVKHASDVVDMHDLPSVALRRKKESSLHVALNLVKQGEVDAFISAGNTGAVMAISKLICRMLPGIDRPALATVLPNINGVTVMIDVGANVDCKPLHLLQFAVMGHVYAKHVFGIENPRIGLLSIGEEASKGNILTKEVFEPLSKSTLNFIGNAEGRDVFNGRVDVVVCDGFIGNVVLKVSESLAKTYGLFLKEGFSKNWLTKLGYLLVKPGMNAIRKRVDYTEYGGAPLLGLNGVVIISHGSSKAKAIKNAIRVTAESVNHRLNEQILETLTQCEFDVKSRAKATSLWRQLKDSIRHEEKKKGSEVKEEKPPAESQEKPEKAEDQEMKKSWWPLKSRTESEKISENADFPQEVGQKAEQEQVPEQPVLRVEGQQTAVQEDAEEKKKSWWFLKRTDEKDRSAGDAAILSPEPQLRELEGEQESILSEQTATIEVQERPISMNSSEITANHHEEEEPQKEEKKKEPKKKKL